MEGRAARALALFVSPRGRHPVSKPIAKSPKSELGMFLTKIDFPVNAPSAKSRIMPKSQERVLIAGEKSHLTFFNLLCESGIFFKTKISEISLELFLGLHYLGSIVF